MTATANPQPTVSRPELSRLRTRSIRHILSLFLIALCLMALALPGQADTLTNLFSFQVPEYGANPHTALIQASDGNFYGTTYGGGPTYVGTVFKITPAGVLVTLHAFSGPDGANPYGALIQAKDGNLYGTTAGGGANGAGTVFKITTEGELATIYSFSVTSSSYPYTNTDGAFPAAALIQGADGYLYGTTYGGGTSGDGTVFKITTSGVLTTLYKFSGPDGAWPEAALIQGSDGYLYGTTFEGGRYIVGAGYGTVFKITTSGVLTTLYKFSGPNGIYPLSTLIQCKDGNLYGTTYEGGATDHGDGTVFKITPDGVLTTLYTFSGADGAAPIAGLIQSKDGYLYGTTQAGGANGTIFRITTGGAFTLLYSFSSAPSTANPDGAYPWAALIQGADGYLYGTTDAGGEYGYGTVFRCTLTGPDIASLLPNSAHAVTAFPLTLSGSGFVNNSIVKWNGHALTTAFVNANQLTATVTAAINVPLAAYPGSAQITVTNPDKTSGNAYLTINAPAPILKTLAPASLPAGSKTSTLTLTGKFFAPGAVADWNGTALTTTFVSAAKLTAAVPAADLAAPGTAQVSVTDVNGGGTSNSLTFTIAAVPKLTLAAGAMSRDGSGNIVVPVTLDNTGTGAANSLQITSSTLGIYQTTSSVPISLGNLGAGSSAGATLTYPGGAGTKGQKVKLTLLGSYQASGSSKVTNYALSANVILP